MASAKNMYIEMNMDIAGHSYQEDADIQIWTHNTSTLQFKWTIV